MYSYDARIRYSELDSSLKLPLVSLVNLFQDCSIYHSEHIGKGLNYLYEHHRAWIITAWQIEIFSEPEMFDEVMVSTWPYKFDNILGYRNYTLKSRKSGRFLSAASSMWTLIDTQTKRSVRITDEDKAGYEIEEKFEMEYLPRRIKCPDGEYEALPPVPVVAAHLDSNNHMNNGQYLSIADTFLPDGFIYNRIRGEYKKSALSGDMIYPKLLITDNKCFVKLCDEQDKIYTIVEFS